MANKYRAWADGEVLTAANLIDYVQKNVVIPCDSSADYPDSSTRREGMTVYDKNLDRLLVYTTTTTGWVPPWNQPWGIVGSDTTIATSSGATSSTYVDSDLSITTATLPANRYIKWTVNVHTYSGSATPTARVAIRDNSNNVIAAIDTVTSTVAQQVSLSWVEVSTAAALTRKVSIAIPTGSGTVYLYGSTAVTGTFFGEDIGPSGAPA